MTTTPVSHDYPDYARQLSSSDLIINSLGGVALAAERTEPIKLAGNYPYLHVAGFCATAGMRIRFAWFPDNTASFQIGTDEIHALAGVPIETTIPVRGPWVIITHTLSAYPNNVTTIITNNAANATQHNAVDGSNLLWSVGNGGPLGGGANVTITAPCVRPGMAYWESDVLGAVAYTIYLFAVDYLGAELLLASLYAASGRAPRSVHLPAMTMRTRIFNQDAGAHDYRTMLAYRVHML